jgi:fructose-1,6-bisphosphatase/inositol monophosphatase family enzyme
VISVSSSNEEILGVLHRVADAISIVLVANLDWSLSGLRATQYAVDVRADDVALAILHEAGMAVLSEESERTGDFGEHDVLVVMDPLDGSTNASRGIPWYATALCAIDHGGLRASLVVNQASRRDRYWATRGGGAFHNGIRITHSECTDLRQAVIGISGLPKHKPSWAQFRAQGAAALDICLVAEGALDGWIDFNTHGVWDYLASLLICEEAGAAIGEHNDYELLVTEHRQRRTPLVAATPQLLNVLRELRKAHAN